MPVGFFFAPYNRRDPKPGVPGRYCAMDDFTAQIVADGGSWSECECLGNQAVVKVNASSTTLTAINAATGFQRIPARFLQLDQTLGDLTSAERTAILNKLQALGYTLAEIQTALGGTLGAWRTKTLRQVLRFALTRRLRPRYDQPTDTIILDGQVEACRPIEDADADVV